MTKRFKPLKTAFRDPLKASKQDESKVQNKRYKKWDKKHIQPDLE